MTRLEPLIVAALGRSPYEDELIHPDRSWRVANNNRNSRQQYDDRGHPINPETSRRSRDFVLAQNEILQTAGLIEKVDEVEEKRRAEAKARELDEWQATTRRFMGQIIFQLGIWPASGLRRRALVYKDYSQHPLLQMLKYERAKYSTLTMIGAGLPATFLRQGLFYAVPIALSVMGVKPMRSGITYLRYALRYFEFHILYHGTLQQLYLVPARQWLPSLLFLVPFSKDSPLWIPERPSVFTFASTYGWLGSIALALAPVPLAIVYNNSVHQIAEALYHLIMPSLPRTTSRRIAQAYITPESLRSWKETFLAWFIPAVPDSEDANSIASDDTYRSSLHFSDDELITEDSDPINPGAGAQPTPTSHRQRRSSAPSPADSPARARPRRDSLASTTTSHDPGTTTLISFDVQASQAPLPGRGAYSAELRHADFDDLDVAVSQSHNEKTYKVTHGTCLPVNLWCDAISYLAAESLMLALETVVARCIAASWVRKHGGTANGITFSSIWDPSRRQKLGVWAAVTVVACVAANVVVSGVSWAAFMEWCRWRDGGWGVSWIRGKGNGRERGGSVGSVAVTVETESLVDE